MEIYTIQIEHYKSRKLYTTIKKIIQYKWIESEFETFSLAIICC